jgi:pimeloyl-ACP methyl ester carboxylesterase
MTAADMDLYARAIAERPHVTLGVYRTFIGGEIVSLATGRWAGRLRVPTRVLGGEHDFVVDVDRANAAAEHYADDMRAEELPGVGHFVAEEAPDVVVERALALFA